MQDKKAALRAVSFFHGLTHTTGEWAGQPFNLLPWQKQIVTDVFGTKRPDGYRQFQTCWIEIPKKNGKSEFAAGLALLLLVADGEPGAQVYSAATDRDQAGIVYQAARVMVKGSPELDARCDILDSVKRILVPRSNSLYRVLSSESYSKHGYNISGLVVDEVHAHKNRELIDILTKGSGAARRQPLFVFITTAGTDRNSICWEKHEYALRVLKHRQPKNYDWVQGAPIDDPSFYAVVYGLRDDDDWTSEKNWRKANPSLGHILTIEEFKKSFAEAQANAAEENIFKQLRLNIWVKSSLRWMQMPHWDACGEPFDHEELKGKECYAGLDLAATTDLAALALVFPGDDYKVLMRYWIPEATAKEKEKRDHVPYQDWAAKGYITLTPGNVIDYAYIRHELRELREAYDIRELAFDRWGATKLIQDLAEDGFVHDPKERGPVIVPFGQGYVSMTAPTKELMNSVLTGKIRHGGHPVLRWNADNMVVRQDPAGNLKPDKEKATQKIDGVVALIMALDRAVRHSTEAKSVYESRGIITL